MNNKSNLKPFAGESLGAIGIALWTAAMLVLRYGIAMWLFRAMANKC